MWTAGLLGGAATEVSGVTSLSFVASTTSSLSQISSLSIPGTAQAGDLAVLLSSASGGAKASAPVTPTNSTWTAAYSLTFNAGSPELMSHRVYAAFKLLGSDTSVNTVNGAENNYHTVLVFRPNSSATTASLLDAQTQSNAGGPFSVTATASSSGASGAGVAVVTHGTYNAGVTYSTSGATFTDLAFSPTTTKRLNRYALLSGTFPTSVSATSGSSTSYTWATAAMIKVS